MYLLCNTNNKVATVLEGFFGSVKRDGLPSISWRHGLENADMAWCMLIHSQRMPDRGSFITGKSVHNQRIERLWVDEY